MNKFEKNKAAFRAIRKNTPYRDTPFEASTGKLNTDGTVHPNPAEGLDEGYVWVRREGDRAETRALAGKVRTDIANIPVVVAQDNLTGELTVMDVLASTAVKRFGGAWARSMYTQPIGEAFRTTIYGRNLIPGRVKVWISGTLKVNAEEFWYNDTATARVLWEPTDTNVLDLSSNVPAASGGYNQQRWVVIALNPNATTPALVAFNGTAIKTGGKLQKASIKDIAVTAGYTRLAAVQLRTGDADETDITDDEWEDLRPWVVDVNYSAITGAVITNSTIDSSIIGGVTPAAITGTTGIFSTVTITPSSASTILLTVGDGSAATSMVINGAAGSNRDLRFQSAGVLRWIVRTQSNAESGSSAGSDFQIIRRADDGTDLGSAWVMRRDNGQTTLTYEDSSTNTVVNAMIIRRHTTGTPANGLGTGLLFAGESSTTTGQLMARVYAETVTVTNASRKYRLVHTAYDTAERTGLIIEASGSAAMIGFLGAAAVARPTAYTQNYTTATRTVNAYTTDSESVAYTGIDNAQAGTVYAQLTDLNALRTAYENIRASYDNLLQVVTQLIDDNQAYGLLA